MSCTDPKKKEVNSSSSSLTGKSSKCFHEIRCTNSQEKHKKDWIEVVICHVEPQYCSKLVKLFGNLFPATSKTKKRKNDDSSECDDNEDDDDELDDISHLKRVRKMKTTPAVAPPDGVASKNYPPNEGQFNHIDKRQKIKEDCSLKEPSSSEKFPTTNTKKLQILLGTSKSVNEKLKEDPSILTNITMDQNNGNLSLPISLELETIFVPGRSAQSKQELEYFNTIWPTIYFHKNTADYIEKQLKLTCEEIKQIKMGMEKAIEDAKRLRDENLLPYPYRQQIGGAVIVCPVRNQVVASAANEYKHRQRETNSSMEKVRFIGTENCQENNNLNHNQNDIFQNNPFCTPILLAIQNVSRKERQNSLFVGANNNKKGQYICTGYDLYVTKEPEIFESMALVHSRIRRVIYGVPDERMGGLGKGNISLSSFSRAKDLQNKFKSNGAVHCLPGTNHKYRVFRCGDIGEVSHIVNACMEIHGREK